MLGEKLKNLRELDGLTQAQVAKSIGVTRFAISKYETNDREPDYSTLKRIANFYKVTVDELLEDY